MLTTSYMIFHSSKYADKITPRMDLVNTHY